MSDEPKTSPATPPASPSAIAAEDAVHAPVPGKMSPEAAGRADHDPGNIPPDQMRAIIQALQADLDEHHARMEAKDAQLEAANDKVLRSYADLDNMRKRVEREKEDTTKYAITKFARDVVAVADNFERAVVSVPAEAKVDNPALNALVDGVTLTEREFINVLERHGVKRMTPEGQPFNPNHHQAVMENNDPSVAAGTVLKVFQPGYLIDDRVLRPAMVVEATGGAKAVKPAAESNGNSKSANGQPSGDGEAA